jgi:glutathione-regulated potassium-efflux system ancillary protein KefC
MDQHGLLINTLVYLAAAVVAVPIAKRLGLGSVLGYLIAGVVIGPFGLRLITNVEDILHFAEFGVVLLLFLIGLELNPRRLWGLRKSIIGVGGAQVVSTTLLILGFGMMLGFDWKVSLVAAMGLSLSSTAIALQTLTEKSLMTTPAGNNTFSVLLFQDIAVIPILALLPLLGVEAADAGSGNPLLDTAKVIAVIAAIVVGGHYLIRPVIRYIANTKLPEIFTAFSLLLVIGIALLMQSVDMSMALGTFLAGVLLADSEYRHELETDIEPFKGLLLGLFFISVGMSIDFGLLLQRPGLILALVGGLIAAKMVVILTLGRVLGMLTSQNLMFAFLLAQGGEFAFVIFSVANSFGALDPAIGDVLVAAVALSMLSTPLLMIIHARIVEPRFANLGEQREADVIANREPPVIIAGFGRFGQIIARLLHANGIATTIIDHNPQQIDRVREFGYKVFYGDASRMDLLHAAGADQARLLILALDDRDAMHDTIAAARQHFPGLKILARAWDMVHAYELLDLGVTVFERETFESALSLGESALVELGFGAYRAKKLSHTFKRQDLKTLYAMHAVHQDQEKLISVRQEANEEMGRKFEVDEQLLQEAEEQDWN